ncbi:MAG TPA: EamA family transporter, partial [Myxococcota bacterium]|nr:EamA family transporter [Myxococcota bacterium]
MKKEAVAQGTSVVGRYVFCTLVGGTAYAAYGWQVNAAPTLLSLFYQLIVAAALFAAFWSRMRRRRHHLTWIDHLYLAALGLCNFSVSAYLLYRSAGYLVSAYVIIAFSTKALMNPLLLRFFLRQRINAAVLWGGAVGLAGIAVLVWPSLTHGDGEVSLAGLGLALAGTAVASLGDVISTRNARLGIRPV